MLYVPNTDFINIVHLSAIVRYMKCTFLDCFYTHLQLGRADEIPSPMGRHFIDMVQKSFFAVCVLLYLPKTFFQHMNFVGIASHITCTFLSDYSINLHVYMLISVYILIFLHIFCLGMLGIDH